MSLNFNLLEPSKGSINDNVIINESSYILHYPCGNELSDCTPYVSILPRGSYALEVWGAQGGLDGGKGGYSFGIFTTNKPIKIFINIGAKGSEKDLEQGVTGEVYNGGGSGYSYHSSAYDRSAGSGGGATDICFLSNSIYNRAIVAGGGGGSCYGGEREYNCTAGYGGGIKGGGNVATSSGGTQDSSTNIKDCKPGAFGKGGSNLDEPGTCGGGGGGWYGGSTGGVGFVQGGLGGSGYALHSKSIKPADYKLLKPIYFLKHWELIDGSNLMRKCDGYLYTNYEYEQGHAGFGCARITILESDFCILKTYQIKNMKNMILMTLILINS